MLNHFIAFPNKSLRVIFTCLRLYNVLYFMLENKNKHLFIWVYREFELKIGIEK
jgi:hypothetical protein